jgi:type III pantothenate kinase
VNSFILTIDSGNTNSTCCLFGKDADLITNFDFQSLKKIITEYDLKSENTHTIVSSVSQRKIDIPFHSVQAKSLFANNKFLDMPIHYNETLGIDRIAAAYFCYKLNNFSKLIIDTGSFTTVDHVDIRGFNGGFILPGLNLLSETYRNGDQLYKAQINEDCSLEDTLAQFPQTTQQAINQGALISFLTPIKSVIQSHNFKHIILTGGNAKAIENFINQWEFCKDVSVSTDQYLIHRGLYKALKQMELKK